MDVAMLLRDVMMPLPLRDGWGEDLEWPYPGIPAAVVAEFAGYRVAGPTQMSKQQRTDQAREAAQTDAADADRHSLAPAEADTVGDAMVVPLRPTGRARHVERAIDTERRRRREAAVPVRPGPPPLLGDAVRHGSLFLLPDDDDLHVGQDQ